MLLPLLTRSEHEEASKIKQLVRKEGARDASARGGDRGRAVNRNRRLDGRKDKSDVPQGQLQGTANGPPSRIIRLSMGYASRPSNLEKAERPALSVQASGYEFLIFLSLWVTSSVPIEIALLSLTVSRNGIEQRVRKHKKRRKVRQILKPLDLPKGAPATLTLLTTGRA